MEARQCLHGRDDRYSAGCRYAPPLRFITLRVSWRRWRQGQFIPHARRKDRLRNVLRFREIHFVEKRASEVCTAQVCAAEQSAGQRCPLESCVSEICISNIGITNIRIAQVQASEIRIS